MARLPSTAGAANPGCSTTGILRAANLSGPSLDFPATTANSCCESCSNDTLNSREAWIRRVVREPGCSAIATIGGTCETYITVPVAHERSPPWAAPMIATGCAMRERINFAAAYLSVLEEIAVDITSRRRSELRAAPRRRIPVYRDRALQRAGPPASRALGPCR